MTHHTGSIPDTHRATDWRDNSACSQRGVDPDVFHATEADHAALREARAVCAGCPTRVACLTSAYQEHDEWGIRAGLTPRQRKIILKKADRNITRAVADALGDPTVLLKNLYWQHTQQAGRHRVWTDHRDWVNVRGKPFTVNQLAWRAIHGFAPEGHVVRTCEVDKCVADACLADDVTRKQATA
ncbi:WhiB family transcriptional regulator [Streptomyces sp. 900105755]